MNHIWHSGHERSRDWTASSRASGVQRHLTATQSEIPQYGLALERMSPALDALSLEFAIYMRNSKREGLDVGCGEGIATIAALARGAHVMAVDRDPTVLERLLARVPSEQYRRVKLRHASLPEMDFKFARFSAVHASRVLHFLPPDALQSTLRKFFRWLYPDGKLFVSALNPLGSFWRALRVDYSRRTMSGEPWPGYFENLYAAMPELTGAETGVHLLDETVLTRELKAAGFILDDLTSYTLPWDVEQLCTAVVAHCGS
jgi:ubiquinone/menaquinone biosynthesis C-methylase UbiE